MNFSATLRRFLLENNMGAYTVFADFLVEFLFLVVVAFVLMRISAAGFRMWNYRNSEILAIIPSFAVYALAQFSPLFWHGLSPGRQYYGTLVLYVLALGVCWTIQERREDKRRRRAEDQATNSRIPGQK